MHPDDPSRTWKWTLGACALVSTGVWLGMTWLRATVLGLPVGVWLIAVAAGVVYFRQRRDAQADEGSGYRTDRAIPPHLRLFCAVTALIVRAVSLVRRSPAERKDLEQAIETRLSDWLDRHSVATQPLRIGLAIPAPYADALRRADGECDIRWTLMGPGYDAVEAFDRYAVDAFVTMTADGSLEIMTNEASGRDAGWYDWCAPLPLSYASIFPTRIDPSRISVGDLSGFEVEDFTKLRLLIEAGALLSRSSVRLGMADRLRGRAPLRTPQGRLDVANETVEKVLTRLAAFVSEDEGVREVSNVTRVSARIVSAWLGAHEGPIDSDLRREGLEAAARQLPDEPQVQLRLVAVRFADLDDAAGFEALAHAGERIRAEHPEAVSDHLSFLQAEFDRGGTDAMTLGRVAAGLCLLCATTPPERADYVYDDVLDDMRYSGWLIGRDHDRALLVDVLRVLTGDDRREAA